MDLPSAKLSILVGKKFACLRVVGFATAKSSLDLRKVMGELFTKGYRYFVLELSECALMDSTFLGTLVKFGLAVNPPQKEPEGAIELLNPNARILELLESLCVLRLFRVNQRGEKPAGCDKPFPVNPIAVQQADLLLACEEAHQALVEANSENRAKFVDVLKYLRNRGTSSA